jgi:hypothetical protein
MELFMNRFYVATFIAAVTTISLASRVLMLRGSRSAIPRMLARARFNLEWVLRGARNFVDDWIAGSIARREPRAAIAVLHELNDRGLRDLSLGHDRIGHIGCRCEQDHLDRVRGSSAVDPAGEVSR